MGVRAIKKALQLEEGEQHNLLIFFQKFHLLMDIVQNSHRHHWQGALETTCQTNNDDIDSSDRDGFWCLCSLEISSVIPLVKFQWAFAFQVSDVVLLPF